MRIDSLTSLRFFAATAVLLHHLDFLSHSQSPHLRGAFSLMFEGFNGVTFFFVLSGFIISHSFSERLKLGTYGAADFLFFRLARLYPIHVVTLVIAFFMYVGFAGLPYQSVPALLSNIVLLQSSVPGMDYAFTLNGVSWSISVEMFFYVAFCFVGLASTRRLAALWLLLAAVIGLNLWGFNPNGPTGPWLHYINPGFRFVDFLTGMLLYRLFVARPLRMSDVTATKVEVGCLVLLVLAMLMGVYGGVSLMLRWDVYYILPMSAVIFVFAHQQGMLSRALSWRPLVLLGDASFALYMFHQLVINFVVGRLGPLEELGPWAAIGWSAVIAVVATGISVLSYLYFEKPLNARLRAWWMNRRSHAVRA